MVVKSQKPGLTPYLQNIVKLRAKEAAARTDFEAQLSVHLAAVREQLDDAIYEAKERGASWAAIKQAYGTQDHRTLADAFDRAVSRGVTVLDLTDGATWHWDGDNVVIESYVFEGQDIGGAVLIPSASGWDFQDPYVPLFDWFAAGHIEDYKTMIEGFVK